MQSSVSLLSRRHRARVFLFSTIIGLSLAAFSIYAVTTTSAKPKIGQLPKDSLARHTLTMLDGRKYNLADLRGKVVVLDFFASWCGHSKQHIPTMTKFTADDQQRGLQIVGLAVEDDRTTRTRIDYFIREMGIAYPVGMVSDPVFSKYVDSKDVSVPQTLVFARDGKLVAHFAGHDENVANELTAIIKRELDR
jgi:thiol-disulfide isomerase/thioredoxin